MRRNRPKDPVSDVPALLQHLPKIATLFFSLFALYLLPFALVPAWNEARLSQRILQGQRQKLQDLKKDWELKRRQLFGLQNDPQAWIRALDDKGVPPPSYLLSRSSER